MCGSVHTDDGHRISVHIAHGVMGSFQLCRASNGILGIDGIIMSLSLFARSSSLFALVIECLSFLLPSSGLLFLRLGGECSEFRSKLRGVSVGDCGVVIIVSSGQLMMCMSLMRGPRWVRGGRDTPTWLWFEACRGVCRLKRNW